MHMYCHLVDLQMAPPPSPKFILFCLHKSLRKGLISSVDVEYLYSNDSDDVYKISINSMNFVC